MSPRLEWSATRDVAVLTFDRPTSKNAIDRASMATLAQRLDELEAAPELLAVIVTGAGDAFVSGGDLKDLAEIPESAEGLRMSAEMQGLLERLEALPVPTFAVINGDAYGGGCELMLACDVRIMKRGSKLEFRQTAMGLSTGWGGGRRLLSVVGRSRAILLLTTGLPLDADEALELGLVDRVSETPRAVAEDWVGRLRGRSRRAILAVKKMLTLGASLPPGEAMTAELEAFGETWGSPEHRAAVARFLARN